jgi:hypothetical protein
MFLKLSIRTLNHLLRIFSKDSQTIQRICFRTLHIVLSLSKNSALFYFSKHNVSKIGFSLRLQVRTYSVGLGLSTSRFYLKTKTESSLRDIVFRKIKSTMFSDKDRTMVNVQKHIICTNVPSSRTFRSHPQIRWLLFSKKRYWPKNLQDLEMLKNCYAMCTFTNEKFKK